MPEDGIFRPDFMNAAIPTHLHANDNQDAESLCKSARGSQTLQVSIGLRKRRAGECPAQGPSTGLYCASLFGQWGSRAFWRFLHCLRRLTVSRGRSLLFGISHGLSQYEVSRMRRSNLGVVLTALAAGTAE